MNWFRWDDRDLLIRLHVQPRAHVAGVVGPHGDALKVKVKAPPEGGRANREIISLLAETFDVPRSAISVKSGASSRRKQVRVHRPAVLPTLPGLYPARVSGSDRIKQ